MDAITMLREDHRSVEKLFKSFEKAGDRALKTKRKIADDVIAQLSVQAAIEEQVFYPAVREKVADMNGLVLESLEEHHIAKWVLSELDGLDPEDERFEAKMTVLIENVRHHVKEEETELFPSVRKALGRKLLTELGDQLAVAKKTAPTHPRPRMPDTPPGNLAGGLVGATVDVARDVIKGSRRAVASKTRSGRSA